MKLVLDRLMSFEGIAGERHGLGLVDSGEGVEELVVGGALVGKRVPAVSEM